MKTSMIKLIFLDHYLNVKDLSISKKWKRIHDFFSTKLSWCSI